MRRLACLVLAVCTLPACVIYFDDDDPPPCAYGADEPGYVPDPGYLNPYTLQCETFGGPYPCDDRCGPCPLADTAAGADLAQPSWGSCASSCRGLDEYSCGLTAGCRTTYDDYCLRGGGPCTAEVPFLGCQPVDMTGPIQGSCEGLDAWDCSRHDDCLATYRPGPGGTLQFASCQRELPYQCGISSDCAPPPPSP